MSDPTSTMNSYISMVSNLVNAIEGLRVMQARFAADGTLSTKYFALTPVPRSDLVAQDFTNAQAAVTQMLFTYDSGAPSQKSQLFKLL